MGSRKPHGIFAWIIIGIIAGRVAHISMNH